MQRTVEDNLITKEWTVEEIENIKEDDIPDVTKQNNRSFTCHFRHGKRHTSSDIAWWGCEGGISGIKKLQKEGWSEGLARAKKVMGNLNVPMTRAMRRLRVRSDFGDSVDMQRIYRGDFMRAWERRQRIEGDGFSKSRIVRMLVNASCLVNINAKSMFWRGALASILTEELEAVGHPVEIIVYAHTSGAYLGCPQDWNLQLIKVKEAGFPVDLERLTTITALAGWWRFNIFNAMMTEKYKTCGYFGACVQRLPKGYLKPDDIHITDIFDKEAAIKQAKVICKKLEGERAFSLS